MIYKENKQWQGSIILSTLLHIVLIGIFFFGMPSVFDRFPEEKDVMVFEILPLADIANINNETKTKKEEKLAEKSRLIQNRQIENKEEEKKQDKNILKDEIEKKPVEKIIKREKTPIEKKKPKPNIKKKTPIKKKIENSLDSIFKNLEKESEGIDTKTSNRSSKSTKAGNKNSKSNKYDKNSPLLITEEILIRQQIEKLWYKPSIISNMNKFYIKIVLELNEDCTIRDHSIEVINCPINGESACNITKDSADRAIRGAAPFRGLLPKHYNSWRNLTLMFESR